MNEASIVMSSGSTLSCSSMMPWMRSNSATWDASCAGSASRVRRIVPNTPLTSRRLPSLPKRLASSTAALAAADGRTPSVLKSNSYSAIRRTVKSTSGIWSSGRCGAVSWMISSSSARRSATPAASLSA